MSDEPSPERMTAEEYATIPRYIREQFGSSMRTLATLQHYEARVSTLEAQAAAYVEFFADFYWGECECKPQVEYVCQSCRVKTLRSTDFAERGRAVAEQRKALKAIAARGCGASYYGCDKTGQYGGRCPSCLAKAALDAAGTEDGDDEGEG